MHGGRPVWSNMTTASIVPLTSGHRFRQNRHRWPELPVHATDCTLDGCHGLRLAWSCGSRWGFMEFLSEVCDRVSIFRSYAWKMDQDYRGLCAGGVFAGVQEAGRF